MAGRILVQCIFFGFNFERLQCDKTYCLIKKYRMKLHNFVICLLFGVILAEDDPLEDVQTEFYLPYSETEDVDFSLSKPSGFGCYQW